jgi:hypothetical protein
MSFESHSLTQSSRKYRSAGHIPNRFVLCQLSGPEKRHAEDILQVSYVLWNIQTLFKLYLKRDKDDSQEWELKKNVTGEMKTNNTFALKLRTSLHKIRNKQFS